MTYTKPLHQRLSEMSKPMIVTEEGLTSLAAGRYEVNDEGDSLTLLRHAAEGLVVLLEIPMDAPHRSSGLVTLPLTGEDTPPSLDEIASGALQLKKIDENLRSEGYKGTYKGYDDGVEIEYALRIRCQRDLERALDDFSKD